MVWLSVVCVILSVLVIALGCKLIVMRRAIAGIDREFERKLSDDTNTLITVSTRDKVINRHADRINAQLKQLRRLRLRYIQGDRELKSAVTNISHDLRTPLTAINGYLDLLEQTDESEDKERYLQIIRNRIDALKQLTEELFRYSVITSPEADGHVETVVVNGVLEESIAAFYTAFREKGITPDVRIAGAKVIREADREALRRVFLNLLENALKYSGGDLEITMDETGQIMFANMAPELTQVQVARLFDRFYTVENARSSTGLGLSIARHLLGKMNGTISAEYENGRLVMIVRL